MVHGHFDVATVQQFFGNCTYGNYLSGFAVLILPQWSGWNTKQNGVPCNGTAGGFALCGLTHLQICQREHLPSDYPAFILHLLGSPFSLWALGLGPGCPYPLPTLLLTSNLQMPKQHRDPQRLACFPLCAIR